MKNGWVYILKCTDDSYYTGSTSNIEQRITQHNTGFFSGYTARRLPVRVVFVQQFNDIADAIHAERQIKGWSRQKKEALIAGNFDLLCQLSRSRTGKKRESGEASTSSA
jgi:putative endonuclease